MKYLLTIKEFSKETNSKVGEWLRKFDSIEKALKCIDKVDASVSKEFHTFDYVITRIGE